MNVERLLLSLGSGDDSVDNSANYTNDEHGGAEMTLNGGGGVIIRWGWVMTIVKLFGIMRCVDGGLGEIKPHFTGDGILERR